MSIFDQYQKGSWRGEPFLWVESDGDLGRRVAVHEYPQRDDPYVEDLGGRANTCHMEIMVAGPGYMAWRDRLMAALNTPGAGTLVHPTLGQMNVKVIDARGPRESTREGGTARFWVVFIQAGELREPSSTTDTRSQVSDATSKTDTAAKTQLSDRLTTDGLPFVLPHAVAQVTKFAGDLQNTLMRTPGMVADTGVMKTLTALSGSASTLIYAPIDLYQAVQQVLSSVETAFTNPGDAYSSLLEFADYAGTDDDVPQTTASRRIQAENRTQLVLALSTACVCGAARAATAAEYGSQAAADAARDALVSRIDDISLTADAALYAALTSLRAAIVSDLSNRPGLKGIKTITLTADMPALVLAHRLYGDASYAPDIVTRNAIAHPGFIPAGRDLEVLDA